MNEHDAMNERGQEMTRNGSGMAVPGSMDETLEILGDPDQVAAIREGMADLDNGRVETLSKDEILARIKRPRTADPS